MYLSTLWPTGRENWANNGRPLLGALIAIAWCSKATR